MQSPTNLTLTNSSSCGELVLRWAEDVVADAAADAVAASLKVSDGDWKRSIFPLTPDSTTASPPPPDRAPRWWEGTFVDTKFNKDAKMVLRLEGGSVVATASAPTPLPGFPTAGEDRGENIFLFGLRGRQVPRGTTRARRRGVNVNAAAAAWPALR